MNREQLHYYLEADRISLGCQTMRPRLIGDDIWKFERALRYYEFWLMQSNKIWSLMPRLFWRYRYYKLSIRLNFENPPFVVGPGLSLAHRGPVIINPHARIGKNCRIHSGVNIGTNAGTQVEAPTIGDNCYIGPGAKLFGLIKIGNGIAIAAQAVVNRTFDESNVTLGGIPARIISNKSALPYLIDGAKLAMLRK
ncbi:MAG: serine acetyltransferase [Crocinitomicaceae bacterium]|nr:serine acetyltransferase [Crocinitomicaceae bacterium]